MKSFRQFQEDGGASADGGVAANNAGGGNIAGIGVGGRSGEPGVPKKRQREHVRKARYILRGILGSISGAR